MRVIVTIFSVILFVAAAFFFWPNRPVKQQYAIVKDYHDPELNTMALYAAFLEQMHGLTTGIFTPVSLEYLSMAKRYYTLKHPGEISGNLFPKWLMLHGFLPEVAFPTTIDKLHLMNHWDIDKLRQRLTDTLIASAIRYQLRFDGLNEEINLKEIQTKIDKQLNKRIVVYSTKLQKLNDQVTRIDHCQNLNGQKTCFNEHPIDSIGGKPALVLIQSKDNQARMALYCGIEVKDQIPYFRIHTPGVSFLLDRAELESTLLGTTISQDDYDEIQKSQSLNNLAPVRWLGASDIDLPTTSRTLIMFSTPACTYCNEFMAAVGKNLDLKNALNRYRLIKVNIEMRPDLTKRFKTGRFVPKFLVFDDRMREVKRVEWEGDVSQFVANLKGGTK